jgi:ribosomal protein S4
MSSNVYKPFYKKWKHLSRPIFGEHEDKIRKFKKQKWRILQQRDLKPSILKKKQNLASSRFIFGNGLKQKKALKLFYGLKERQVKKIVRNTNPYNSSSGRPLGGLLERQLGTVLYRLNFVPSMAKGRQLISHKKIKVNGKTVWAKNYPLGYLDLLELELGPTRELVNTIKSGPSITRLKKSNPYSKNDDGSAMLATKAEYALNTYKDRLTSSFDGLDLKLNEDGDSLVPTSVNKVTNIAPVENATILASLDFHDQGEDGDGDETEQNSNNSSTTTESGVQNESLFNELIEGTNDLKNHTLLDVRHPGLNAIGKLPNNGQLYSKHVNHRWEERLNEQILIHVGNENFSKDSDGMLEFSTRHAVVDALNEAKECEIKSMQEYVTRSRKSNFEDLALKQESNKTAYKPMKIRKIHKNKHQVGNVDALLRDDCLTHHKSLRRAKYKPFLSLRKPSLQHKKRIELLKLLLKNKKHPNMQIDHKNLISVYVKELQTDEVKYPFQFSYKEFLEFYNI